MRRARTSLGYGLIPRARTKRADPALDEKTIAAAAEATGVEPAEIRNAVLRLVALGAADGEEIPIFVKGPKAEGTVYVRRVRTMQEN